MFNANARHLYGYSVGLVQHNCRGDLEVLCESLFEALMQLSLSTRTVAMSRWFHSTTVLTFNCSVCSFLW